MAILATSVVDENEAGILAHLEAIRLILEADVFEEQMGAMLRDYCRENLPDIEDMALVHDKLAQYKIISKANFRALWLK